jgi:hypothetical protein
MSIANGLKTANCGVVKRIQGLEVELLGREKGFSTHPTNIVCYYFMENGNKVQLTYHGNGYEVYFYKGDNVGHYKSFAYNNNNLPNKYKEKAEKLVSIYNEVFGF